MLKQFTPVAAQSRHWYDKWIGVVPDQPPFVADRLRPTCASPTIAGNPVFVGGVGRPATALPASARPARTANRTAKLRIEPGRGHLVTHRHISFHPKARPESRRPS